MNAPPVAYRHVIIHGRVQGVGYRAWAAHEAIVCGLEGFVRNRRDGTVEALFAGPAETVAAVMQACRRGPPAARVDRIEDVDARPDALRFRRPGESFSVLPTA